MRPTAGIFWLVLATGTPGEAQVPFAAGPELPFHHRSGGPEKRYILETMGSGVAVFDYDGDSDLDLYFVNAASWEELTESRPAAEPNRLFRNDGSFRFTDVTEPAGLGHRGFGQGVAVGDVDNDGDPDLYLTNYGANVLYRNNGDGSFDEVDAGVSDRSWGTSAAFADVDGDGFLDLYLCNYLEFDSETLDRLIPRQFCLWKGLPVNCGPRGFPFGSGVFYRNRMDVTFEDRTVQAGLFLDRSFPLGVVFSDLDEDGDSDLYLATDSTPNLLFENQGGGRFQDVSIVSGAAFSHLGAEQAGMGVDAGDVNGDGMPDLFVTNFSDDYNSLYLNQGELRFIDATDLAGLSLASLSTLGWSTLLEDFDLDTDLDIFVVNGHVYPQVDASDVGERFRQPMQIYWNEGAGVFRTGTKAERDGLVERASRGAAMGDLDGDGDADLVVNVMDGTPVLLENRRVGRRSDEGDSVRLRLVGRRTNRDGLGVTVRAEIGARRVTREIRGSRGYLSYSDPGLILGLGGAAEIDRLVLRWPSGMEQAWSSLAPGRYVILEGIDEETAIRAVPLVH